MPKLLSDVAALSGVSQATASRVLNRRPGVAEGTRQMVLEAAETLKYRPTQRPLIPTELIGVVAQDTGCGVTSGLVEGVLTALQRRDHLPILCSPRTGAPSEGNSVRRLLAGGASGLIFLAGDHTDTTANHEMYRSLENSSVPHVLVGGTAFPSRAARLSNDDSAGVSIALRHLFELGHVRTGMILGADRFLVTQRKMDAFFTTLGECSQPTLEAKKLVENSYNSKESGFCATEALFDRGCTAIVCDSDEIAIGALRAARSRSLSVPDDLSLIVLGDSDLALHTDPPLTVVSYSVEKMSESIADALIMTVNGTPLSPLELFFPPDLIFRGSVGRAPLFSG
ncbi:LacI family DNA-binding transcriptional regulator [Streptomyces sp. YGL11-2]|uniref:LacI family DNA-binding transcriptional regulator n=1 Tax=Streptomyces sp. YGL11-2 TaxID=3414028 RepID=UPI003CEFB223